MYLLYIQVWGVSDRALSDTRRYSPYLATTIILAFVLGNVTILQRAPQWMPNDLPSSKAEGRRPLIDDSHYGLNWVHTHLPLARCGPNICSNPCHNHFQSGGIVDDRAGRLWALCNWGSLLADLYFFSTCTFNLIWFFFSIEI